MPRIRKLLALAEDQAGTPEGDAAARLARRLMHTYDLAGEQLGGGADADELDPIVRVPVALDGRVLWRRRLAAAVARHCECALSWSPGQGRAYVYGRRSGVAVAQYLHAVLRRELDQARQHHDEDLPMMIGETERVRQAAAFAGSAVLAIETRLAALRGHEAWVAPEQCAVVSRRGQALRDWMDQRGQHFSRQAPTVFSYSQEGYAAGLAIALYDAVEREGSSA